MKFDLHCHTKEGSPDGSVMIELYIRRLKEMGFRGMLVSDHDSYDGYRRWKYSLKQKEDSDFVVLKGVEYDTFDCGHFLVIMPVGVKLRVLEMRGMPAAALIKLVHHYGGILGPAHPFGEKYLSAATTRLRKLKHRSEEERLKIFQEVDFIEGFNACEGDASNARATALANQIGIPTFGGSDAHRLECIGKGWAELPDTIRNENDLIAFVKQKPVIECGGSFYSKTVRDMLGPVNFFRINGFFVYNKLDAARRGWKRRKELKKLYPAYKYVKKDERDFTDRPDHFEGAHFGPKQYPQDRIG